MRHEFFITPRSAGSPKTHQSETAAEHAALVEARRGQQIDTWRIDYEDDGTESLPIHIAGTLLIPGTGEAKP